MESERREFIDTILNEQDGIAKLMNIDFNITMKSSTVSELSRLQGNELFAKDSHTSDEHESILRLYSKSICLAADKSEDMALAYGNRSAFLVHVKKYEASIMDIDRAINITCFKPLKVKLLCRKVKCLVALKLPVDNKILDKIQSILNDIPPQIKTKITLVDLFEKTRALTLSPRMSPKSDSKSNAMKELDYKEDIFKSVAMKYEEKYGRHLVATRNIQPGEIVFVERYYASCLNYAKEHINCHHCFRVCWSGVPCDLCSWVMFCSEECKRRAIDGYHDIECSIIPYIKSFGYQIFWNVHLCIRIMIMALKRAGGIAKLKQELNSINKLGQNLLMEKGIENTFSTVFSLSSNVPKKQLMAFSVFAPAVIIFVGKQTSLLGKNFQYSKIKDLAENKDFVFLGSLFIKLLKIRHINSYLLSNTTLLPKSFHEQQPSELTNQSDEFKNAMGCGLSLVASFINHSCNPNVRRCFTRDKRLIIYAVQPIQKGSQIFDSYCGSFYESTKKERQDYLKQYMFTCKCIACENDWKFKKIIHPGINVDINQVELFDKLQQLTKTMLDKFEKCDSKIIQELSSALKQTAHCLPGDAPITSMFYPLLIEAFNRLYGFEKYNCDSCAK